jgi:hypothetical protein
MILRQSFRLPLSLILLAALCLFTTQVSASYGDRLPEFQRCVEVECPSSPPRILLINFPGLRTRELWQRPCLNSNPYASLPNSFRCANFLQLCYTGFCSGTAHQNATTPANTSSPTNASQPPSRSCNSTANGPSTAF